MRPMKMAVLAELDRVHLHLSEDRRSGDRQHRVRDRASRRADGFVLRLRRVDDAVVMHSRIGSSRRPARSAAADLLHFDLGRGIFVPDSSSAPARSG